MIQARAKGFTGAFGLIHESSCVDDVVESRVCQFEAACQAILAERRKYENQDFVIVATPTHSKFTDFDGFII
jgi:hypothetical protein